MCPIDWCAFTWEAFATLVTGVAVVGGAYVVGARQTKILDRQVALEEHKARADLFETRFAVYRQVREAMSLAITPEDGLWRPPEPMFEEAFDRARFLFRQEVIEALEAVRISLEAVRVARIKCAMAMKDTRVDPSPHQEALAAARDHLIEQRQSLPELFGVEMRSSHP